MAGNECCFGVSRTIHLTPAFIGYIHLFTGTQACPYIRITSLWQWKGRTELERRQQLTLIVAKNCEIGEVSTKYENSITHIPEQMIVKDAKYVRIP